MLKQDNNIFYKILFFTILIIILSYTIKTDIMTILNIHRNKCVLVNIPQVNIIWNKLNLITKKYGLKTGGISHVPNKANGIINYFRNKKIVNIAEIGFNAGHSTSLFLILFPHSKITIFDLMSFSYSYECLNFLKKTFPNRIKLIKGDSTKNIPGQITKKFDLVHVDGNHDGEYPKKDLNNSIKFY